MRRRHWLTLSLLLNLSSVVTAQDEPSSEQPQPPRPAFELVIPSEFRRNTLEPSAADPPERETPLATSGNARRETLDNTQLDQTLDLGSRLIAASRSAFLRGLMDLPSYATHLEVARQARLIVADQRTNQAIARQALRDEFALWNEAVDRLRTFNQPASQGWAADLALATLLSQRTRLHQHLMDQRLTQKETAAEIDSLQQTIRTSAQRHFDLRLSDYQIGRSTALQMVHSARYLDERPVESLATLNAPPFQLQSTAALSSRLSGILNPELPRGIVLLTAVSPPESDLRTAEQYRQILIAAVPRNDRQDQQQAIAAVESAGQRLFVEQLDRVGTGTSALNDLLETWWAVQQSAAIHNPNSDFALTQRDRLARIRQISDMTRDPRGRNAADMHFAQVLGSLYSVSPKRDHKAPSVP